jgi:hypothetical protein
MLLKPIKRRCIISGKEGCDLHHVSHKGNGGSDEPWNLMPLARQFHSELHQIGKCKMAEKYPQVRQWLIKNGWVFCPVLLKWTNEKEK